LSSFLEKALVKRVKRLTDWRMVMFCRSNKAGRDMAWVWPSVAYLDYGFYHRHWRVPSSRIVLAVITVQLYHLREVGLSGEHVLNSLAIKMESVSRDLEAVLRRDSISQCSEELVRCFAVSLANRISGNQFCFCIQRDKNPSVA
jgi:hypothetical protein